MAFNPMTADMLEAEYGVQPWQWIDFQIIVGGQDGLKGCDGVGPKGAAAVLKACGSLDKFFDSPFTAPLTGKQRTALIAFRPQIDNLRRLVTLVDSAPLPATWLEAIPI
ncbi:MAG: 5'-3' exonuclease H3TH domain-containing protein [Pirellulales bacterium]